MFFQEDAYTTFFDKAAALFAGSAQNHAFYNGNKWTAFMSLLFFLGYNGYQFSLSTAEKIEIIVDVVKHVYTLDDLAANIRVYSRFIYE